MKPDAGFTLLEALVALTVLALLSVSLISASTDHISRIAGLEDRAFGGLVADARLAELRLDPGAAFPQNVTAMGRDWRVEAQLYTTDDPDLVRVEVRVRPDGADGPLVQRTGFADQGAAQ